MALFTHGLDKIQDVMAIRDNVMSLLKQVIVTTEWTSQSQSYVNQFGMPLKDLKIECDNFLAEELLNKKNRRRTNSWIVM